MAMKRLKYVWICIIVLLVCTCLLLHLSTSTTVDFSGRVQDIHLNENNNTVLIITSLGGESEYNVMCDDITKVVLYKSKVKIELTDIAVGDIVDGKYRLFSQSKAKSITVVKPQSFYL